MPSSEGLTTDAPRSLRSPRAIAVDWSGAASGAERRIWLAEVRAGEVVRLECGRSRAVLGAHLVDEAARDARMVVGLDFAFSLPSWFLAQLGIASGPELWEVVARDGERWLRECASPFWGRPGKKRPELPDHLRRADREVPAVGGIRPKSVFQIGGAGAVGTGSLRGMPFLRTLRAAGFAIWPFDAPRHPVAMEIYPRILTGAVVKSSAAARAAYLEMRGGSLTADVIRDAVRSEDAFDALVSALAMDAALSAGESLPAARDELDVREGRVWAPALASAIAGDRERVIAD